MNYQMTIWKAGLCLLLSLPFLSQPISAAEESKTNDIEEIVVGSDNPIMIIRCRFDDGEGEEMELSSTTKADNSKMEYNPCGFGFKIDPSSGGCIPNCNSFFEGSDYEYQPETGYCECTAGDGLKGNTSKNGSECSFCFYDYLGGIPGLKGSSTSKKEGCKTMVCPQNSPLTDEWVYDPAREACFQTCFDGELVIDVPLLDCGNLNNFGHIAVQVCFSSADPSNPLIDGQTVPFEDIKNCFGDAGEVLIDAAGIPDDSGESFYFDNAVFENGKLCVEFFVDPDDPILINFSNSSPIVRIETCASEPCSCENPDNIRENGVIVRFADVLSLTGLPPGVSVGLNMNNNPQGFTDENGVPYAGNPFGMADLNGNLNFPFFRNSNEAVNINYQHPTSATNNTPVVTRFINGMTCDVTRCLPIPTMGQWGLMILALLLSSLGLVFLIKRKVA